MLSSNLPKTLCQIIENMEIGGAQRTASNLMKIPDVQMVCITYDELDKGINDGYDAVLLHVWPESREHDKMNWPKLSLPSCEQLVVFNHDWRGLLNIGADKYIVYSQFALANIQADGPIYVVPGGIPTRQYIDLGPRTLSDKVIVGRLSTMHPGKISTETIDFWKKIPASQFVIGGDGSQRLLLLHAFENNSRFSFPGMIPPTEVPLFLNQIDIFLYDTVWHVESFCYVVLEAMAAGCVVVAKDKGALNEIIAHGRNGYLYNTEQEAIDICSNLVADKNVREDISDRARKFALSYPLESIFSSILDVMGWPD